MAKIKVIYVCQNCGNNSVKWQGRCTACGEWNTYLEETVVEKKSMAQGSSKARSSSLDTLADFDTQQIERIVLPDDEMNRVTGGGIVPGSVVLLAGEPGIGKSTLLLQMAVNLDNKKILYISGEESLGQIKMRAKRYGGNTINY
jgi:DNA repair protein RadA/Sms